MTISLDAARTSAGAASTPSAAARFRSGGEFVLDACEVFGWATDGAAAALTRHRGTGTLTPGAPADLIILGPLAPKLRPVVDGFGIVVHSGSAANLADGMFKGEWLVRNRRPTRADPAEVIAAAQEAASVLRASARG